MLHAGQIRADLQARRQEEIIALAVTPGSRR